MLDPAILQHLEAPMPPQVPTIVHERVWQTTAAEQAERLGRRLIDSFKTSAQGYINDVNRLMKEMEVLQPEAPGDEDIMRRMNRLVDDVETYAELRAKDSARLAKRINRDVKAMFKQDPSVAAVQRSFGAEIIATEKRMISTLLDFALFLRTCRAQFDAESRGGKTFDSESDLSEYLSGLLAA